MTIDTQFNKYKPVRNKLRKLSREKVVPWCIEKLHESYWNPPPRRMNYLPWQLFLLLKWALANCPVHYKAKKIPNEHDLHMLLSGVYEFMDSKIPYLDGGGVIGINKFVRMIGFQQFWTQRGVNVPMIGRHIQLFSKINCNYPISDKFFEFSGISLNDFFELAFSTQAYFVNSKAGLRHHIDISPQVYRQFSNTYREKTIELFLNHLSLDMKGASELAKEHTEREKFNEQSWEKTPFILKPLLRAGQTYFLYSPHLLTEIMRYHVYDCIRERDSRAFSKEFGYTFEQYLKIGLEHSGLKFYEEAELKKYFPKTKVVDFILPLKNLVLLVESKAIEMAPSVRANPSQRELARSLKSTIVSAFEQIHTFLHNLQQSESSLIAKKHEVEYHAFIVTYKELYLVDGLSAWEEFIKDEIQDRLDSLKIDHNLISPVNIHFLSVEAWDKFIALGARNDVDVADIVRQMVIKNWNGEEIIDRNYVTAKLTTEMHLDEYDPKDGELPYLKQPFEELIQSLAERFGNTKIQEAVNQIA